MRPAALTIPIDAARALLEACRVPGQLEIDYPPAGEMKIQTLASGVRGKQERDRLVIQRGTCRAPFLARQATVKKCVRPSRGKLAREGTRACRDTR